jgi:capsular exopolysaccharide synthesis family protein
MRQTKAFPESERAEQALVKVQEKPRVTEDQRREQPPSDDHASIEKIHHPNQSQALQTGYPVEASSTASTDGHLSLLREWGSLVYRYKWLIVAILAAVLPFVAVNAYRDKPIYLATATIEVRREGSSLKPNDIFSSDVYDNTKSEAFIIRSRPVVEKTVANLRLDQDPRFLEVHERRSVWEAIEDLTGMGARQEQKSGPTAADQPQGVAQSTAQIAEGESVDGAPAPDASPDAQDAPGTPNGMARDAKGKDASKLTDAEREKLKPYTYTLMNYLRVDNVRDTRLLKITFTHTDPAITARVANGVAQNFIEHNFQNKTLHIDDASAWLEDSTRKLKDRVTQAEQKLASYSREHNIIPLDGKESLTTDKLVNLHGQVARAEMERLIKQSLYDEARQGRVGQLPEAFADAKTAELKRTLGDLQVTASQLSVRFGSKHPKLVEVQQQMDTIQKQIEANRTTVEQRLKAGYEHAVREENSLRDALGKAKTEAVQQNQAAIQYSILQQDLATAKALYTEFLNKTSQANIQRAEQYNNVRLVESADTPSWPIGPNRTTPIVIWTLLSLAVGIGLAWLFENLNTKVKSIEDLGRAVQLPMLATIPTLSDGFLAKIRAGLHESREVDRARQLGQPTGSISLEALRESSVADEAYRMLRTSVLLSTAGRPPKTILMVSAQPGDGKTTTVINTAIAFTQLKAEVLIIDCDMRKPTIHKLARLDKGKGLSTYLSRGGEITDFIRRTPIPYLSILPCGPLPPNPSELVSSEGMREMLHKLSGLYDYIIIDSPPLIGVTDPIILSTIVDGAILVARSGKSKSEVLRHALQDLSTVRARVLGVILNNFNKRRNGYESYYSPQSRSDQADRFGANGAGD